MEHRFRKPLDENQPLVWLITVGAGLALGVLLPLAVLWQQTAK